MTASITTSAALSRAARPLLAALSLLLALSGAAAAKDGVWRARSVEGRAAAEVVTLVGEPAVAANRVVIYCDAFGQVAASFARRPGMPARSPVSMTLFTDAGDMPLGGRTNLYGALIVEGPPAREAARLLARARRDAAAVLLDGPGLGEISVVGSTRAIERVLEHCPAH